MGCAHLCLALKLAELTGVPKETFLLLAGGGISALGEHHTPRVEDGQSIQGELELLAAT